ncbi:MAG: hypothetical protein ACYDER_27100 [Ktedonobacteraceae bacterium]
MYYRVAIQTNSSPAWKWKSTVLSSLDVLFRFLKLHHTIPAHKLRIFTSTSREDMNEMLLREKNGLDSNSVTAEQFLLERHLHVWETERSEQLKQETQTVIEDTTTVSSQLALLAGSMTGNILLAPAYALNPLDRSRQEIEFGTVGDHDCPYVFTLPQSIKEMRAWIQLLEKAQHNPIAL